MSVQITILGCNSATPTVNSHPSAQLITISERMFLMDCGEGTQVQLRKYKIKFSRINNIFISHLHGDHFFGLIGLISSFALLGRDKQLNIYGPKGLKDIIVMQLRVTETYLSYHINFVELDSKESEIIYEDDKVEVLTIPLKHRIYCNGYLFKEKEKPRVIDIDAVKAVDEIDICDYQNLKNGKNFKLSNGDIIPNKSLTKRGELPKSYAYCSDTMYKPDIVELIKDVDILYHETTFLSDLESLAKKTGHSTAQQASKIAIASGAKKLIIGHYSNRYRDVSVMKKEADQLFENTILGKSGLVVNTKELI